MHCDSYPHVQDVGIGVRYPVIPELCGSNITCPGVAMGVRYPVIPELCGSNITCPDVGMGVRYPVIPELCGSQITCPGVGMGVWYPVIPESCGSHISPHVQVWAWGSGTRKFRNHAVVISLHMSRCVHGCLVPRNSGIKR